MINPHYDLESGHHDGDLVEQDARAWLGIWKSIEDVPDRQRLQQYADVVDADKAWDEFCEEYGQDWTETTRKYQYGKAWREWTSYCEQHAIHRLCPEPSDVEGHLVEQRSEAASDSTLHQTRFRPLCRLFEYLRYSTEYPHKYNPAIMAVLFGGAAYAAWRDRISNRLPEEFLNE